MAIETPEQLEAAVEVMHARRRRLTELPTKRCGRVRSHNKHRWVPTPGSEDEFQCLGNPSARALWQLPPAVLECGVRGVLHTLGVSAA